MAKPKSWDKISIRTKQRVERRVRGAAVRIMNDLAERGPNWSGVFRDSWEAVPLVAASGGSFTGFPYNASSVPRLAITNRDLRSSSLKVYDIVNGTDYALIAMDLEPGDFWAADNPKGEIVLRGERQSDQIRGHIAEGEGNNRATAERDWYANYIYGGGLEKAMRDDRPITGISLELAR
jgi:hypothetical protein